MGSYLDLLRARPAYRALFASEVISVTGDWFSLVAVSILTVQAAGASSGVALAWVLAAHLLPQALFAPAAGWLADRYDRRALLMSGALVEGLLTIAMVAAAAQRSVGVLQVLLFLRASVASLREPAAGAALPTLVEKSELTTANALGATAWSTTFVVGMALGGLATELGPTIALAIDAATFFVAAVLLRPLPRLTPPAREGARTLGAAIVGAGRDVLAAARVAARPGLRASVFGKTPSSVAAGAAWVALNLQAQRLSFVATAATTLGVLQAVRGVGTGVGPLLARRRWLSRDATAHLAALAAFLGCWGVAVAPTLGLAFAAVFLWGVGGGGLWVLTQTEIQERSDDAMRGRLLSLDALGFTVGMGGTALLFGALVDRGVSSEKAATAMVAVSALSWLWLRRPALPTHAEGGAPRASDT
jgi:MFS family permease